MTGRRTALAWIAGLPLIVAGCATPTVPPGAAVSPSETTRWAGRFAVTLTEAGADLREESASGRFLLESAGGATLLELRSPLGQTMASATLNAGGAELVTSDGKRYQADSAEQLTERVFGWRMPLGNLPDWLRGRLAQPIETDRGRPLAGVEHGWAVRLENWRPTGPSRLTLDWPARPGAGLRKVNLKLVVDEVS